MPAPVLSFARSYLPQGDISQSTLGSYAPSWLIEQLPLLLSLIAGYVAIMSAMRAARVAFRSASASPSLLPPPSLAVWLTIIASTTSRSPSV